MGKKILEKIFPQDFVDGDFYSFVYEHVKCIILCDAVDTGDHIVHFESEGIKGQEQQSWLEKKLSVDRKRYPFVFLFPYIPPNPAVRRKLCIFLLTTRKRSAKFF